MKSIKYLIALAVVATLVVSGFSSFSTSDEDLEKAKNKTRATYKKARLNNLFQIREKAKQGEKFVRNDGIEATYDGDVIIVEFSRAEAPKGGLARAGFANSNTPVEFTFNVRRDHINCKGDFTKLMNEVYSRLNVSNPANHPVLVIEPDEYNSWRRVDYAEVLMGERNVPWMYVMWQSMVAAYGHDPGTGTVLSYHAENDHSSIVAVIAGWPYTLGYGVEFAYNEPDVLRKADSVFWTTVRCPYADRGDLLKNIIVHGNNFTPGNIADGFESVMEERINIQRLLIAHDPTIPVIPERQFIAWRGGKKLADDGIMLSWDLAFTQQHFQQNGAEYIRQWVF